MPSCKPLCAPLRDLPANHPLIPPGVEQLSGQRLVVLDAAAFSFPLLSGVFHLEWRRLRCSRAHRRLLGHPSPCFSLRPGGTLFCRGSSASCILPWTWLIPFLDAYNSWPAWFFLAWASNSGGLHAAVFL
eukprot:362015-Chlamydomonas_euryale.AAC.2